MKNPNSSLRSLCGSKSALLALVLGLAPTLHSATWTDTDGGLWSVAANWSTDPSLPANNGTENITFNSTLAGTSTVDSNWSVAGLTLLNGSTTYTIDGSGSSTLTLGSAGIDNQKTAGTVTLGSNLTLDLAANQSWGFAGNNNDGRLILASDLTGTGNVSKTGTAALVITGLADTSGWSGAFTFDGGSANPQGPLGNNPFGTKAVTMRNTASTSLYFTHSATGTLINDIVFEDTGSWTYSISMSLSTAITLAGDLSSTSALGESIIIYDGSSTSNEVRLTGDNSGLTSTLTTGSNGAFYIRGSTVVLETDSALGLNNGLYVKLGESSSNSAGARTSRLLAMDTHDVTADIMVAANANSAGISQASYIGLSGTGAVEFSGDIILENTSSTTTFVGITHLTAGAGGEATFSGVIQERFGATTYNSHVIADGGGKVIVSGTNTYVGGTTVSGSTTFLVSNTAGSGTGTGAVAVESGSTLGGTGTIAPGVTNGLTAESGSFIAPGASIGTLKLDGGATSGVLLTMDLGAKFSFELNGSGVSADQIAFWNYVGSSDFVLNDNAIDLTLSGAQVGGNYTVSLFTFFSNAGTTATGSGITSGLSLGNVDANISGATLLYNSGAGTIDLNYTVVPEPSVIALLVLGVAGLVLLRRRTV